MFNVPAQVLGKQQKSVITADVQMTGTWCMLKELEDPELARPASQLPSTMLKSRADSSAKKHLNVGTTGFQLITCQYFQLGSSTLPCIYRVLPTTLNPEEAVNMINWAHMLAGLESPANSKFVQATLQGIRSCCKPV